MCVNYEKSVAQLEKVAELEKVCSKESNKAEQLNKLCGHELLFNFRKKEKLVFYGNIERQRAGQRDIYLRELVVCPSDHSDQEKLYIYIYIYLLRRTTLEALGRPLNVVRA